MLFFQQINFLVFATGIKAVHLYLIKGSKKMLSETQGFDPSL